MSIRATDLSPEVARARKQYEGVKTILAVLTVLALLGMMAVVTWSTLEARDTARDVRALLRVEQEQNANRQAVIDRAVAQIAAEQYRALVAHDQRTEALLKRINRGVQSELNDPTNREDIAPDMPLPAAPQAPPQVAPTPAPAPRPAPAPVGPPTGVQPAPAPAPAPSPTPCEMRGKSGKCRK